MEKTSGKQFGTFSCVLNMYLSYEPAIPLLGICSKERKTYINAKLVQMFITALFISFPKPGNKSFNLFPVNNGWSIQTRNAISNNKKWTNDRSRMRTSKTLRKVKEANLNGMIPHIQHSGKDKTIVTELISMPRVSGGVTGEGV